MEQPKSLHIHHTADLQMRFFGSEVAVFDVDSAQTHLLNIPGAMVLRAIESGVRGRSALEAILAESMPDSSSADMGEVLDVYLENFDQLGLLTLVSGSDSR